MRYPWLFILPLVGVVVAIVVVIWRSRQAEHVLKRTALIAHTAAIKQLPEYRSAQRRYYVLVLIMMLVFVFCLICGSLVTQRPTISTLIGGEGGTRDIMFCVDISAMSEDYKNALNEYLSSLETRYGGERIGVSLFDGETMLLVPFSKDYGAIAAIIGDYARRAETIASVLENTSEDRLTRVGDGVVACLNNFDKLGEGERVQSLVIVSDNLASSAQTASIAQAVDFALRYNVAVYGIDTGRDSSVAESAMQTSASIQFRQAVSGAGGSYYPLVRSRATLGDTLAQIEEQDRARVVEPKETELSDAPQSAIVAFVLGLALLLIIIARLKI